MIGMMKKRESPLFVISDDVAMIHRGSANSVWQEDIVLGLKRSMSEKENSIRLTQGKWNK